MTITWQRTMIGKRTIGSRWHAYEKINPMRKESPALCGRSGMWLRYDRGAQHMVDDPPDGYCSKCMGITKQQRADG